MKKIDFIKLLTVAILIAALPAAFAAKKIFVVATLTDLADIAGQVGGDRVEVTALAKGYQDPHFVDAKPSLILKLQKADLFIQVGLDLEIGWVPPLLDASRNKDIYYGGKGYVNASEGIELLEVPKGDPAQLRAQGDIHVWGNPHYWLSPINGKKIAENICNKLKAVSPADEAYFTKNLQTFQAKIDSADVVWQKKIAPYKEVPILAYHNSWPYFSKHFHLDIAGFIEPKPGIPPSPAHLLSVIKMAEKKNIRVIIISPYYDDKPAQSVAGRANAVVVPIAPSVGAFKEVKSYFDLFDYNINTLLQAFKEKGVTPTE